MMAVRVVKRVADSTAATILIVVALSAAAVALTVRLFGLTVAGAIALYFVIWWTFIFAVLPFGVRSQAEHGEVPAGTEPGAPVAPALREKALWTTLVAACVLIARRFEHKEGRMPRGIRPFSVRALSMPKRDMLCSSDRWTPLFPLVQCWKKCHIGQKGQ